MLISDISYLETVSEKNIEGGNGAGASFRSRKTLDITGEALARGFSKETLDLNAETGSKSIEYTSVTRATAKV